MRVIEISERQMLINKINNKTDFTHFINANTDKRYIVGCLNLYTGKNPSTDWLDSGYWVRETLERKKYDTIGGWLDTETGIYYVDASMLYLTLSTAMNTACMLGEKAIYDWQDQKVLYVKEYFETNKN